MEICCLVQYVNQLDPLCIIPSKIPGFVATYLNARIPSWQRATVFYWMSLYGVMVVDVIYRVIMWKPVDCWSSFNLKGKTIHVGHHGFVAVGTIWITGRVVVDDGEGELLLLIPCFCWPQSPPRIPFNPHTPSPTAKGSVNRHSMILVGARTQETSKKMTGQSWLET